MNRAERRRARPGPRPADRATAVAAGKAAAARRGCTCEADLTVRHIGNITVVDVAHDDSCPALHCGGHR